MIIGITLCLLVLACISAIDAAVNALGRHRLGALLTGSHRNDHFRQAIAQLIEDPYYFTFTTVVPKTVTLIAATALTIGLSAGHGSGALTGSLASLLVAVLALGELLPRAWAVRHPEGVARLLAGPVVVMSTLLWPVLAVVRVVFVRLSGRTELRTPLVAEEELRLLMNVGEEQGLIEQEEREMIEGIIAFGDTLVREIMVPRVDIVALESGSTLEHALDVVSSSGHSRIPVYEGTIDRVIGILYAKDLIPALRHNDRSMPINTILRPVHFVPETMKVNALLEDLQRRKVHMAIIVDEYGGTAGLATIEDLIEQIVGEIQDEYDTEDPSVQPVSEDEFIVDARLPIEDVNDLLGTHLTSETAERIGGLVYEHLGRVPRQGDQVDLGEVQVTVQSIKGMRAHKLRIERRKPAPDPTTNGVLATERAYGPT
jgi:CBS domain containing-hemolysin-like protein